MGAVGNVGDGAVRPDLRANAVGVVALIGNHDGVLFEAIKQRFGAGNVMDLARRDQELERAAFRIDPRVDLRGETSSASPHTTISTLFLAPEAC